MIVGQAARDEIAAKYPNATMETGDIRSGVKVINDGLPVGLVSYENPNNVMWLEQSTEVSNGDTH